MQFALTVLRDSFCSKNGPTQGSPSLMLCSGTCLVHPLSQRRSPIHSIHESLCSTSIDVPGGDKEGRTRILHERFSSARLALLSVRSDQIQSCTQPRGLATLTRGTVLITGKFSEIRCDLNVRPPQLSGTSLCQLEPRSWTQYLFYLFRSVFFPSSLSFGLGSSMNFVFRSPHLSRALAPPTFLVPFVPLAPTASYTLNLHTFRAP